MASRHITLSYVGNAFKINKKTTLISLKSMKKCLSRKLPSLGMYKQSLTRNLNEKSEAIRAVIFGAKSRN